MASIKPDKIIKRIHEYTLDELLKLRVSISGELNKRGMKVTQLESAEATNSVISHFWEIVETTNRINFITGMIIGAALAGFGNVPREQIKKLASDLISSMNDFDFETSRAEQKAALIFETKNIEFLEELRQACKDFYSGKDLEGNNLYTLIKDREHPTFLELLEIRNTLKPGRKDKQQTHTVENNNRIHAYVQAGYGIEDAIEQTLQDWYEEDSNTKLAQRAIRALEGDSARRGYYNWVKSQGIIVK